MFKKQLIPLAVILVLLTTVLVLKQRWQTPSSLEEQLELKQLAPSGFLVSDAARVEIYRGGKENEKIVITRKDNQWYVESKFNSPGKKEIIEGLLDKMKSLEGEFRSDEAAVISDYALEEDKALHIAIHRKDEKKAGYHLIIGKKENYGRSFVRLSGENTVYTVNVNLTSEIGIWGEEDKVPEPGRWLNKTVVDLDKEKIVKVALKTPDRLCVFEKQEEKKEEKKEAEAAKTDTETKKKMKWVLVEGGLDGGAFKQSGLDAVLRSLDLLSATDVEDPDKKNELGLDNPGYRCEVEFEEGNGKTVLLGARKEADDNAYLMVEGKDIVYKLSNWTFKGLFKDGKDLFDFKGLIEKEDKVNRITLKYPSTKVQLIRKEKEWTISSPQIGLEFKKSSGKDIAKALVAWSPADYTDEMNLKKLGLTRPEMTASFRTEDGKKHTIVLGAQAKGTNGRYALLDDNKRIWVASSSNIENMFPKLGSLFELEVVDIDSKDITRVQVKREDSDFVLEQKKENEWVLTAGKRKIEADKGKVDEFLKRFSPVTASDLALGQDSLMKNVYAKVRVDAKKKKRLDMQFGAEKDGSRAARVSGNSAILLFSEDTVDGLVPLLKDLEKAKAPPQLPSASDKEGNAEAAKPTK